MRNIDYKITPISDHLFVEGKLTGTVRNSSWNLFINEIISKANERKSIYLLINENNQVSEIDFSTMQELINTSLKEHFDLIILSFITNDPLKVALQRLFRDMAQIANVPLKVTFHRTVRDAESLIRNFCLKCEATMFPKSNQQN